jgi:hypothetical protein
MAIDHPVILRAVVVASDHPVILRAVVVASGPKDLVTSRTRSFASLRMTGGASLSMT